MKAPQRVVVEGIGVHHRFHERRMRTILAPSMFGGHAHDALEVLTVLLVFLDVVLDGESEQYEEAARIIRGRPEKEHRSRGHPELTVRVGENLLRLPYGFAGHRHDG